MRNTSYLCSWKITQNIFIGARVGGIGLGIYGMVGVFILVFIFGMHPGKVPIDVMLDESLDPKNMLVSHKYIK